MQKDKIASLKIRGFQSHADTYIEFCDGLNVIVGPTGSGKSGIIRALEFILFNKLEDPNFITKDMDTFEGEATFESGKIVKRIRNKKENMYVLYRNAGDADPVTLTGFGEGPVEEVLSFHGIKPIKIGKKDRFISVHSQHDQAFFLTESAGDKAKLIGSIAKTDIIDEAIAELAADTKREQVKLNAKKSEIAEKEAKLTEFAAIDAMHKDLGTARVLMFNANQSAADIKTATDGRDEIRNLSSQYKKFGEVVDRGPDIDRVAILLDLVSSQQHTVAMTESSLSRLQDNCNKVKRCDRILSRASEEELVNYIQVVNFLQKSSETVDHIVAAKNRINQSAEKLKKYSRIEKIAGDFEPLSQMFSQLEQANSELSTFTASSVKLSSQVTRFHNGTAIIKTRKEAVSSVESEISDEIARNPSCPVCGSDLTERKEAVLSV